MKVNKIYETKIIRQNNEGLGIGIINGITTFIKGALPNEIVKVKIDKIYKNYAVGMVIQIVKKSENRVKPVCPYYSMCGGCDLMHIEYNKQLEFKKDKIKSVFKKISNIDIKLDKINSYNILNYRNKVVFKVRSDKIGFYKNKTNEIIDIKKCMICDEKINTCLSIIRKFISINKENQIGEVMIRVCNDEVMITIDNIKDNLKEDFINAFDKKIVKSIFIKENLEFGKKSLIQTINGLNFNVSSKSFFQINIKVASNLYNEVLKHLKEEKTVIDLYSGTGTITLLLSKKSKKVIGIEVVKDAIKDAKNNMILNNISNVIFKCGKVEKMIDEVKSLDIDALILDPPRSGSDKKTLNDIINLKPKKIIYVSCNPVTLARDYNTLKGYYNIKEISAFDMFPNTKHVECVCVLERR